MVDDSGPRNDVLAERIDNLAARITSMDTRMDGLATEKTLIALIEGRDRAIDARLKAQQDIIADLTADLAAERAERIAAVAEEAQARKQADTEEAAARRQADSEGEDRIKSSRIISYSAVGTALAILTAVVMLINNIGGAPS